MLQISADLTVLSKFQREAFADFILSFPTSGDDPVKPCPIMEVDPALWTSEEQLTLGPTDEQLKAINYSLREIVGEATTEQIEAAFRSVMTPGS